VALGGAPRRGAERRGHGRSDRHPRDLSRAAFVADAVAWFDALGLAPAAVVGQSLGGHTAFLLAARHPERVQALVVAEATPEPDPGAPASVGAWLDDWPVPFSTRAQAAEFFGGGTRGRVWAAGLEHRDGGLRPAFDPQVMTVALADSASCGCWDDWNRIRCPTLVVRAADGDEPAVYQRMVAANRNATLVEVGNSGHDVHLDQPTAWRAAVEPFVLSKRP
jgi:pimeloyl-ACP methyl ester carboxylesterase